MFALETEHIDSSLCYQQAIVYQQHGGKWRSEENGLYLVGKADT